VLGCLGFRGRINRDAKESDRFEVEPTVPVNLLLFLGASIGSALDTWVEGRKSVNGMRGTGNSDSPRGSSAAEELLEEDTCVENERESISKASPWNLATRAPLENRDVPNISGDAGEALVRGRERMKTSRRLGRDL